MGSFGGMLYPWTVTYPISRCQWFVAMICMGIPWLRWYSGHLYCLMCMYLNRFEEIMIFSGYVCDKNLWHHALPTVLVQGTSNLGLWIFITLGRFPATCILLVWYDARICESSSEWEKNSWKHSFGMTLYGALDENGNIFQPISFHINLCLFWFPT